MSDISPTVLRLREKWRYRGETRPPFAIDPGPEEESVWDYPRPPRIDLDERRVEVRFQRTVVADSRNCLRLLETASPPVFYIPPSDIRQELLRPSSTSTLCEWKGRAAYWSVSVGERLVSDAAWSYPEPFEEFEAIAGYLSFYPAKLGCFVEAERVQAQPGGFYGGWVTSEIVVRSRGNPAPSHGDRFSRARMSLRKLFCSFAVALPPTAALGQTAEAETGGPNAAIQEAVERMRESLVQAYNRGDAEAAGVLYAEDAMYVGTAGDVVYGRARITAGMAGSMAAFAGLSVEPPVLNASGEVAYEYGRYTHVRVRTGRELAGDYLLVYRRQADNEWRIQFHLVTRDPEP